MKNFDDNDDWEDVFYYGVSLGMLIGSTLTGFVAVLLIWFLQ